MIVTYFYCSIPQILQRSFFSHERKSPLQDQAIDRWISFLHPNYASDIMNKSSDTSACAAGCSKVIQELRETRSALALQVNTLASELRISKQILDSEGVPIFKHFQATDEKSVLRKVRLAGLRARKALLARSSERGKSVISP